MQLSMAFDLASFPHIPQLVYIVALGLSSVYMLFWRKPKWDPAGKVWPYSPGRVTPKNPIVEVLRPRR